MLSAFVREVGDCYRDGNPLFSSTYGFSCWLASTTFLLCFEAKFFLPQTKGSSYVGGRKKAANPSPHSNIGGQISTEIKLKKPGVQISINSVRKSSLFQSLTGEDVGLKTFW